MNQEIEINFKKGTRIEQIERSCFYLFSIFAALDADPQNDAHPVHSNAIVSLTQIGAAFTDSIYRNISDFIEPDEDKEMTAENTTADSEANSLGVLLSKALRHPDIPPFLFGEIMQAVNTVHSDADREKIDELETSPEMLSKIFEAYKANHTDDE